MSWRLGRPGHWPPLPPRFRSGSARSRRPGQPPVHSPGVTRRPSEGRQAQGPRPVPGGGHTGHHGPKASRGGRARFVQVLLTQSSDGTFRCGGGPSDLPDLTTPARLRPGRCGDAKELPRGARTPAGRAAGRRQVPAAATRGLVAPAGLRSWARREGPAQAVTAVVLQPALPLAQTTLSHAGSASAREATRARHVGAHRRRRLAALQVSVPARPACRTWGPAPAEPALSAGGVRSHPDTSPPSAGSGFSLADRMEKSLQIWVWLKVLVYLFEP